MSIVSPARAARRIIALAAVLVATAVPVDHAGAARQTAGGFTTSARLSSSSVTRGAPVTITARVTASTDRTALVDVEVYDGAGRQVAQQYWGGQTFTAGAVRSFPLTWTVPAGASAGTYRVDIGVFRDGWGELFHWNHLATSLNVVVGTPPPTTTTPPPTTTTLPPTTTAPPTTTVPPTTTAPPTTTSTQPPTTTAPPSGRFVTLPPGSTLPSDAECAARVRRAPEIRPQNAAPNANRVQSKNGLPGGIYGRVTGNFAGTTDEIIQWAACKWGIDEDIVRAQTAKESWWTQGAEGDLTTNPAACPPGHGIGVDGFPGQCPESYGVQQLRYAYWGWSFPEAITSTAFNLDASLAARRSCFEGYETWFNDVERGRQYAAGDLWGCVGAWFSGRWYTQPSVTYIAAVQDYLNDRIWETEPFINFRG